MRSEVTADPLSEMRLQRLGIVNTEFLCARLHLRGCIPFVLDRLVAADVHVPRGKQLHDFAEHVLDKTEGLRFEIEQMRMHAPVARHGERQATRAERRVCGYRGLCVSRQFDFGNNLHMTSRRMRNDFAHLGLSIETAVASAPGAY